MVLFAGPVFTGWYWDPIFFAIVFGPVLVGLAFVVDRLVGRKLAAVGRAALVQHGEGMSKAFTEVCVTAERLAPAGRPNDLEFKRG